MFKNSKISISKPNDASTSNKTKSATLARSIIELMSLLHSINVILNFFPTTIVTGPLMVVRGCFVKCLTKLCINVDFPTLGGPTTAT